MYRDAWDAFYVSSCFPGEQYAALAAVASTLSPVISREPYPTEGASMFPYPCFRLRVLADLTGDDACLYTLGLTANSIAGLLYALTDALSHRVNDGTIERDALAAELVEILRPMALTSVMLPAAASWSADATLRVHIAEESVPGEGIVDVVRLAVRIHPGENRDSRRAYTPAEELERELIAAATIHEWNFLATLDGVDGNDEALYQRLCAFMNDHRSTLATRTLFFGTSDRARLAVLSLYVMHDARESLRHVLTCLDKIYQVEQEFQLAILQRTRAGQLQ
jgi:hypothetical protein